MGKSGNLGYCKWSVNPYPAKLIYLIFHPFKVVSRYRDPQLQVGENTHICLIWTHIFANIDI